MYLSRKRFVVLTLEVDMIYFLINYLSQPWVTGNNATCPTCRDPVRIEELSDRRWMRRIVSVGLWPVTWVRRQREEREAARLLQQEHEANDEEQPPGDRDGEEQQPSVAPT